MKVGDIIQLERENQLTTLGPGISIRHYAEALCVDQLDADIYRANAFNLGVFDVNEVSRKVLRVERPAYGNPSLTDWTLAPRGEYYRACNYHLAKLERSPAKAYRERSDERVSLWLCRASQCSVGVWGEPRTGASHSLPANQGTRDARSDVFELVKQLTARSRDGKQILSQMMEDMETPSIGWMNGTECQTLANRIRAEINPTQTVSVPQALATAPARRELNPFMYTTPATNGPDRGSTFTAEFSARAVSDMASRLGIPPAVLNQSKPPAKQEPQVKIVVERTREIELD